MRAAAVDAQSQHRGKYALWSDLYYRQRLYISNQFLQTHMPISGPEANSAHFLAAATLLVGLSSLLTTAFYEYARAPPQ